MSSVRGLAEQVPQVGGSATEQEPRPFHGSDRPLQFELIPQVCLIADVCHHLRISERQFHYLMARKALALVELAKIDARRRFTGDSVARQIKLWAGHARAK